MAKSPDWGAFEAFVQQIMEREHIPGVSVGVSKSGRVLYAKGFGAADLAAGTPADENTVYGIASVSKSFAALAVMQLTDEGKVHPYMPVVRYLPEFRMKDVRNIESIKLHHCLSHTTGCPPLVRAQGKFQEFREHISYLAEYDTTVLGLPGEYMSYCNDTFMLNGATVERISGQRFRDFVTDRTFKPLGMTRTTYELDELGKWDNVTCLYNLSADKTKVEQQPWPELGTYHVGGGIRSTVLDLLRYGDMYCAGGKAGDGTRVVSEAGVLRMRAPVYPVGEGSFYCYALQITPAYNGLTLVEHGGSLPGVASQFGYVPEIALSTVVLTNLRGAPSDQIRNALVDAALGLPVGKPRRAPAPTFPLTETELMRLVGTFAADESGKGGIVLDGGRLVAELDGEKHVLRMVSPTDAVYEMQGVEKPLHWYAKDGSPAWGLRVGVRVMRRLTQ